jgi:hypothetical protein
LHEVLAAGQPHEQEEEEVSVHVLYFLLPRFPRSRRSFDDAPFSQTTPRSRRETPSTP